MAYEKTDRGFTIYGEMRDAWGSRIRVQESSIVGRPHAYVLADNSEMPHPSPHLTVDQAKELIALLQRFIEDAESPENWRNQESYRDVWG